MVGKAWQQGHEVILAARKQDDCISFCTQEAERKHRKGRHAIKISKPESSDIFPLANFYLLNVPENSQTVHQ